MYELECRGVKLLACSRQEWEQALQREQPLARRVVDLRKVTEFDAAEVAGLKDKGIQRAHIPVTESTWSEQDMDAVRREFLRGDSPVAVLSSEGKRAALMILQHAARAEQWSAEAALNRFPGLELTPGLRRLLEDYLQRHGRTSPAASSQTRS